MVGGTARVGVAVSATPKASSSLFFMFFQYTSGICPNENNKGFYSLGTGEFLESNDQMKGEILARIPIETIIGSR